MMKTCKKCNETKELTEFYAHPKTKDGHFSACILCIKKQKSTHPICECGTAKKDGTCKNCLLKVGLKRCYLCKMIKKTDEFWKERRRRDGLTPSCKACLLQKRRLKGTGKTNPGSSQQSPEQS